MRKSAGMMTGFLCLMACLLLTGCQGPDQGGYAYEDSLDAYGEAPADSDAGPARPSGASAILRVGDLIIVTFSDYPRGSEMLPHEEKIKEDGTITLPNIGSVIATNKTTGQLQREIHDRYVPDYFRRLTVTVRTGDLFFTVSGEVRNPSRQVWITKITLVQAIASAGGFTDFAKEKKVQIIRSNGSSETVNYREILKNPLKDVDIYPGDRIIVPRRFF